MRPVVAQVVVSVASAVLVLLGNAPARAQSCHAPSLRDPADGGFHVGLTQLLATYSEGAARGDYQGIIPAVTWTHPLVEAELALPIYRLAEGEDEAIGLGDVAVDVRVAVLRSEGGEVAFGPELAVSLPTGDSDRELGMGHVMAMPGLWLRLSLDPVSVLAQLSYGRGLGSDASHDHHHDHFTAPRASPRVNPMNMEELAHALGVRYALSPNLGVTARWLGGIPLTDDGVERQVIGPGLHLVADPLDASLEVHVPVAGDPFDMRVAVTVGAAL